LKAKRRQPKEIDSGSALDSTVRRPQPQALESSSSPPTWRCSKPASRSRRRRSAGAKAWTSTSPSSECPCALAGADRAAPERRQRQAGALRSRGQGVAVAGGLAGEGDHPARPQDSAEFGEGLVEVGDVVEDGVAEDQVEAFVLEGQDLGLGLNRGHVLDAERVGGRRQPLQHPGGDVGGGQPLDHAELDEVEREVAGARADLQRVAEGAALHPAERLDQLEADLALADLAEVDAPLGVVLVGGRVVVAGVDVLDVLVGGGGGSWHRAGSLDRCKKP
jgi:hypothetical protein